jgi:indolepyruvate ferredoxin oxidoreductase
MGVGVLSSTLARAGTKEGYTVKFNDKKGLAIRNGAVSAHINYAKGNAKISTIVPNGKADLLLGLDMLEAERSLLYASRARTTAIVNSSIIPTIPMLAGMMNYPSDVEDNIRKHTNSDDYFSGRIGEISELFYGNKLFTNIILLGMAFQKGLIPVSEKNLVDAIMETVSPSQRARNSEAFLLGRKLAAEPEYLEFKNIVADEKILQLFGAKETYLQLLDRKAETIAHSYWMFWKGKRSAQEYRRLVEDVVVKINLDEETNRNLARRVYDMIMWGGLDYARKYADRVLEVFSIDRADKNHVATKAVILNLAKVNLIKDEIYTPLLLTDDEKLERDKIRYNVDKENGDKITYAHLNRPEFEVFGKQIRFNLPQWLAHNWLMNIFKHVKWTRGILTSWGWHKKELGFRDWYNDQVIGFFLKTAPANYELALRGLRVINDPYRPNEFAVTGFREVIYPKMEKAKREFEQLIGSTPPLPEIPVLAS